MRKGTRYTRRRYVKLCFHFYSGYKQTAKQSEDIFAVGKPSAYYRTLVDVYGKAQNCILSILEIFIRKLIRFA